MIDYGWECVTKPEKGTRSLEIRIVDNFLVPVLLFCTGFEVLSSGLHNTSLASRLEACSLKSTAKCTD